MSLQEFEAIIGVQFANIELLQQALTHRSYLNEQSDTTLGDNERMEFLGDAILDFIAADMLYDHYPNLAEGELTRIRSALVRTEALAEMARGCRIGEFIYMGKGEENSGGRERMTNLCRAFEAVIGAIYLDGGLEKVRDFVIPQLRNFEGQVIEEALHKDARSQLQEWSQATYSVTPVYRTSSATGPDHNKLFVIEVSIDGKVIATGSGRSKQSAAQAAAQAALNLVKEGRIT